jgi:hypothetical protein
MRILSLFISAFLLVGFSQSYAQVVGKMFPALDGETVKDKVITIPNDTKGKYTLLGMAYSKKSEEDLNTWLQPAYSTFINKADGLFASFGYDVHLFFIPMYTGIKAAASGAGKSQVRKKVDSRLHPHILFYKGKLKPYKDALAFEKKKVPYFFVLDKNGKIIYATSGKYTDKKMQQIEELLE